jgi:DNA-binding IclR family transcriptional regulator
MLENSSGTVQSTERLLRITEALREQWPVGVTELADSIDMNPATVHKHLKTLDQGGYVLNMDGEYRPTLEFFSYGCKVLQDYELYTVAKGEIEEMTDTTDLIIAFAIEENDRGVFVEFRNDVYGLSNNTGEGTKFSLHLNATGKAILAKMEDNRIEDILESNRLVKRTENTITDLDEIWREIEQTRDRGYAINSEENREGINGVSAGIKNEATGKVGALTLAGPKAQLERDRIQGEYAQMVLEAVNSMQIYLNHV